LASSALLLLVSASAVAQVPSPFEGLRPMSEHEVRQAGIEFAPAPAEGGLLRVPEQRAAGFVPVEVPVPGRAEDWSFAETQDRRAIVALSGGLRGPLAFVVVDRMRGTWWRYATQAGRRLPQSFGNGRGPWPLHSAREVWVLGFESNGRLALRVLDGEGVELAAREADIAPADFRVEVDPERFLLTLRVAGGEPLVVHHPQAPRLEVGRHAIEFEPVQPGGSARQMLNLRNAGRRTLCVMLRVEDGPFRCGFERFDLKAHSGIDVPVWFEPGVAGNYRGRLALEANGPVPSVHVALRGSTFPQPGAALQPAAAVAAPAEVARRSSPPDVVRDSIRTRWDGDGCVVELEAPAGASSVLVENRRLGQRVDAARDGDVFRAVLRARAGDQLIVTAAGEQGAAAHCVLAPVPPRLLLEGDAVTVHGIPGEPFLLVVRSAVAADRGRVLNVWRRTAGADGRTLLPRALLAGSAPLQLVVFVQVPDGPVLKSEPLPVR
jgi:hypothetical protein